MFTLPTSLDEFPIAQIPATPQWSENYAVMSGDANTRTSVYYSIGRNLADRTIWRELIAVALPDGRLLITKNYGRGGDALGPGGGLTKLDVLEPAARLRLRLDGPVTVTTQDELITRGFREGAKRHCRLEVTFDGVTPIWNMKGDSQEAGTIAGAMHFEQIGKANGLIELDGERFELKDGYAARDHSRGVRDVSQYRMHCWINGLFDNGRSFSLYTMQMQGATNFGMSNAAIFENGRQHAATVVDLDMTEEPENPARLHRFTLNTDLGEMKMRVAEILTSFPNGMVVPFDMVPGLVSHTTAAVMLDQLVRLEWNGVAGVGWTERGIARDPLR